MSWWQQAIDVMVGLWWRQAIEQAIDFIVGAGNGLS